MEACEDSAATQECQPMSICGRVLIRPNVNLSVLTGLSWTARSVGSTSVQLAPRTPETDFWTAAPSFVRPKATLKTLRTKCSAHKFATPMS